MDVDAQLFDDADEFLRAATAYLTTDPFSASVIVVYAGGVSASTHPQGPDDVWVTVTDDGEVVGLAMHTPPQRLFLARMPASAAWVLAARLASGGRRVPGVNGETLAVAAFAAARDQPSEVDVRMRMYRFGELALPPVFPGTGGLQRPATSVSWQGGWRRPARRGRRPRPRLGRVGRSPHPGGPASPVERRGRSGAHGQPQRSSGRGGTRRACLHAARVASSGVRDSRHRRRLWRRPGWRGHRRRALHRPVQPHLPKHRLPPGPRRRRANVPLTIPPGDARPFEPEPSEAVR